MAKQQPIHRSDEFDPAVIERNISPATPAGQTGAITTNVGGPARQEDERDS